MGIRPSQVEGIEHLRPDRLIRIALPLEERHDISAATPGNDEQNFVEARQPTAFLIDDPIFRIALEQDRFARNNLLKPEGAAAHDFVRPRGQTVSGVERLIAHRLFQHVPRKN